MTWTSASTRTRRGAATSMMRLDAARVAVAGVEHDLDADVAVGCRAQLAVDRDAVGADGSELHHVGAGPFEGDVGEHPHGGHGVVAIGNQRLAASGSCTDSRTAPSPSRYSMRMPGSPSGVVRSSPGVSGAPTVVAPPRCSETSAPGKRRAERLERLAHVRRGDERAAAALGEGLDGVVADERDAPRAVGAGRDGQEAALVAEHDRGARRRLGEERDDLVARRVLGGAARVERQRLAGESAERARRARRGARCGRPCRR